MNVLVTGASGFAGSHIAIFLAKHGFNVSAISRSGNFSYIEQLADNTTMIDRITTDLADHVPDLNKYDTIIHAAATSPWAGISDEKMYVDNFLATKNLLRKVKTSSVSRLIYLSSISSFGRIEQEIINEDTPIIEPGVYGRTKLLCEKLICQEKNLGSISIRLPAVIGKFSTRNWISEVARQLIENDRLCYYNPNNLFNNVVHVEDLNKFILNILQFPIKQYGPVVLGSSNPIEVKDVVNILSTNLCENSEIEVYKKEHQAFLIDYSRASSEFSYAPKTVKTCLIDYLASLTEH